ncbi:MAG: ABC transporter ATP-binding protein [Reichenbachiella sp.]|uniref:ABC transporter ATP-binding protein n=1 Tax=Reichenbachiella sp. TaxID=2184521 RepID=UPI003265FFE2
MSLSISNLSKTYANGVHAIDQLNLDMGAGMFALLGPNGAGKSSLMRTIATLQLPDTGEISFNDIDVLSDPMKLRKVLGYLPQEFGVYPKESANNLLDYFAILKGVSSSKERRILIEKVLELTNLTDVRKKHVSGYSGGMKQRFGIAQMLLNDPKLIIVDEPTSGLDPAERTRFLNILREIGTENTVIFSTHIVDDVKEICNDMAIINGGQVLKHDTPTNCLDEIKGLIWLKQISRAELEESEATYNVLSSNYNTDHSINLRVHASEPSEGFEPTTPQLDDVYFIALQNVNNTHN